MAGAIYPLVSALCEGNGTISSIYYSSESGFMVSYDHEIISARIGDDGYAFLMNREGKIVTSPDLEMKNNRFETENLLEDPELSELAGHMAAGENGIQLIVQDGREALAAYAPVEPPGWSLAMVLPRDEVIAPAVESYQNILMHTASAVGKIHGTIRAMSMAFLAVIGAILLLMFLASDFFAGKITDSIRQMIRDVRIICQGKLDYRVEVHTNDELETLGDAFNQMTSSLKRYMNNLAEVRADRERIATELSVAMADVSGKGVPAALFMVITKTMLKNYAAYHPSPAKVLTVVNDRLCESNEAGMFVTAFVGVLQISTGEITFSNAGHNYPLLRRQGRAFDWLKSEASFVLAGMEAMEYQDFTEKLDVGDSLFFYTDGVTEALNEEDALYGDDRLKDTLNVPGTAEISLEGLIDYVKDDIRRFAGQAAQADDITMLALMLKEQGDEQTEL